MNLKLLTAAAALLAAISLSAQTPTTDRLTVSDLQSDKDGTFFTISLEGGDQGRLYNAYNFTIELPIGMTFAYDGDAPQIWMSVDDALYPKSGRNYKHSISANTVDDTGDRIAKVICSSNTNADLKGTSGALVDVYVNWNAWTKAGANDDNVVNATDASIIVTKFLGNEPYNAKYDINTDGAVNVTDVSETIKIYLETK